MEPEFMSDALDDLAADDANKRALLALIDRVTDHMDDRSIVCRIRYGSFEDGVREFARYKLASARERVAAQSVASKGTDCQGCGMLGCEWCQA